MEHSAEESQLLYPKEEGSECKPFGRNYTVLHRELDGEADAGRLAAFELAMKVHADLLAIITRPDKTHLPRYRD